MKRFLLSQHAFGGLGTASSLTVTDELSLHLELMSLPIFLVEDDPKLRETIREAINSICDAEVIGTAETEAQAIAWLNEHHGSWRLAVLDYS